MSEKKNSYRANLDRIYREVWTYSAEAVQEMIDNLSEISVRASSEMAEEADRRIAYLTPIYEIKHQRQMARERANQ